MKQWQINQVYNSGKLDILQKIDVLDDYSTPTGEYEYKLVRQFWYRNISVASNEIYQSLQVDTKISKKVGIMLFEILGDGVNSGYIIEISNTKYNVIRVYHNYKKKETEITLSEVIYEH